MTEGRASAGALLRAAREKQGLHIAALAAAIKVAPRKLDALEHDRYEELPDATFTRALAQTVCRSLKIDPQPVLALLPHAEPAALDHVSGTLNTPFRERPGRDDGSGFAVAAIRPMVWAAVGLLVAAAIVYLVPSGVLSWPLRLPGTAPAASAPAGAVALPASAAASVVVTEVPTQATAVGAAASQPAAPVNVAPAAVPAPPPVIAAASAPAPAVVASAAPRSTVATADTPASAPAGVILLRTTGESWVEARDARGRVVFQRTVAPGESVGFNGALPVRLTIGNAPATRLTFRGQPVDLAPSTLNNVARLELQ